MNIVVTEIKKQLLEQGEPTSLYRVTYRANGNLLYQDMRLNNELPDDILKQQLARIAERHIEPLKKKEVNVIGKPKISEFIELLRTIKDSHGDIPIVSAYDGDWDKEIEVMIWDDVIIIGHIS